MQKRKARKGTKASLKIKEEDFLASFALLREIYVLFWNWSKSSITFA
jgi:hypothetical protein